TPKLWEWKKKASKPGHRQWNQPGPRNLIVEKRRTSRRGSARCAGHSSSWITWVIELDSGQAGACWGRSASPTRARETRLAKLREITCTFFCRENINRTGAGRMVKALPLIIKKEEQLVLDDGTADRAAKHVPSKLSLG